MRSRLRFCQAGYQYRPRRQRKPDDIERSFFPDWRHRLWGCYSASLSSTDYEHINELLGNQPKLAEQRIGLGLPSLRPKHDTINPWSCIVSEKIGLTIAPEAGTERLRNTLERHYGRRYFCIGRCPINRAGKHSNYISWLACQRKQRAYWRNYRNSPQISYEAVNGKAAAI